ncbi:hypothetical protein A4S06_02300 [Erysipelotrichaceae bacterium MTC7]|nr:hypothetical protein A4S06_02300 [Erysipelotrichaceae bacterium MTC7]
MAKKFDEESIKVKASLYERAAEMSLELRKEFFQEIAEELKANNISLMKFSKMMNMDYINMKKYIHGKAKSTLETMCVFDIAIHGNAKETLYDDAKKKATKIRKCFFKKLLEQLKKDNISQKMLSETIYMDSYNTNKYILGKLNPNIETLYVFALGSKMEVSVLEQYFKQKKSNSQSLDASN